MIGEMTGDGGNGVISPLGSNALTTGAKGSFHL